MFRIIARNSKSAFPGGEGGAKRRMRGSESVLQKKQAYKSYFESFSLSMHDIQNS